MSLPVPDRVPNNRLALLASVIAVGSISVGGVVVVDKLQDPQEFQCAKIKGSVPLHDVIGISDVTYDGSITAVTDYQPAGFKQYISSVTVEYGQDGDFSINDRFNDIDTEGDRPMVVHLGPERIDRQTHTRTQRITLGAEVVEIIGRKQPGGKASYAIRNNLPASNDC